jgi:hypothetical protein
MPTDGSIEGQRIPSQELTAEVSAASAPVVEDFLQSATLSNFAADEALEENAAKTGKIEPYIAWCSTT